MRSTDWEAVSPRCDNELFTKLVLIERNFVQYLISRQKGEFFW